MLRVRKCIFRAFSMVVLGGIYDGLVVCEFGDEALLSYSFSLCVESSASTTASRMKCHFSGSGMESYLHDKSKFYEGTSIDGLGHRALLRVALIMAF